MITPIVSRAKSKRYKPKKIMKLALNSQLLTFQILTDDVQVLILGLSQFMSTVHLSFFCFIEKVLFCIPTLISSTISFKASDAIYFLILIFNLRQQQIDTIILFCYLILIRNTTPHSQLMILMANLLSTHYCINLDSNQSSQCCGTSQKTLYTKNQKQSKSI